jgi:NAD(P)-dependent dehydrogenase (short-subunit alcohol dehydrogenase family)
VNEPNGLQNGGLEGQLALVTGGGSGLGAEICRTLAARGVQIIAADIQKESTEKLADELTGAGHQVQALELDVHDRAQVEQAVAEIYAHGPLDILINNAGTDMTLPFDELSVEDWERVLEVNLRGPFLLSHAVFPHMKQRHKGSIVNITSTAAKRAWANASAYHASKWGLLGLSHALHVEAREHGVKVTALVAGGMRTPFIMERFPETDPCVLQDPRNVAAAVAFVLTQPAETVIPELMVIPMRETSWP